MANFRILSNNYITSSTMIQASLQKTGVVTNPIKDGTGKATMQTTGAYSTGIDNQYKVQIDSQSTGGIGPGATAATFKWSRNDTVIAALVVTSTTLIALEDGVKVKWSSGLASATDAFGSTLDQWTFEGKNLFGYNQIIDRKRNTRWRSSTNALELHTDANAAADPAGAEADSTGAWVGAGDIGIFDSTDTTASVGTYTLRYQGTTVAGSTIHLNILSLSSLLHSAYKYTYDIRTYFSGPMRSIAAGIILSTHDSTNANFQSYAFDVVTKSSVIQDSRIRFSQPGTVEVGGYIDNISLELLPGFVINLGSTRKVDAVIIQDHNLTSNANIHLKARRSTAWEISTSTSESVDETITWAADKILHYVVSSSNIRRYWRIDITDTANPDGYIEIGNLYLGSYDEMVRNAAVGYSQIETVIGSRNIDPYGVEDNRFRNRQKIWQYRLPVSTDIETLESVFDNIYSSTSGKYDPVWINPTSNSTDFHMVHFDSLPLAHKFRNQSDITLNFREVLKSN